MRCAGGRVGAAWLVTRPILKRPGQAAPCAAALINVSGAFVMARSHAELEYSIAQYACT